VANELETILYRISSRWDTLFRRELILIERVDKLNSSCRVWCGCEDILLGEDCMHYIVMGSLFRHFLCVHICIAESETKLIQLGLHTQFLEI